ncbi:MAG: hypothetical protein KF688_11665 [Pirellulales bacterium]|nr:hypothetical protein [Pirellulales bacterium]MBX3432276.1 hypothetical protein [Pirellulales bacterium]
MDELRNLVWDYLFQAADQCSLDELVAHTGRDAAEVLEAVDHPWFCVSNGKAAVAYATGPVDATSRKSAP